MSLPKPYYDEDGITIYCGDSFNILDALDGADVAITDPPYGEQTHSGARTGGDGSEVLIPFASMTASRLRIAMVASKVRRWWVSFMEWQHCAALEENPPIGWRFVRAGVWVKPNGAPQFTGDRPATGWEAVGIFHREGAMRWNGGGHHAVWTEPKVNGEHPTTKPIALVTKLVGLFSDAGETILDPFMGSGTTLVAAKRLGRRAIGIEIEERYCEIAVRRLAQKELAL